MSDDERRPAEPNQADQRGQGRIMIDLENELTPAELEQFYANAKAAGRTPAEHFKAITIGQKPSRAA